MTMPMQASVRRAAQRRGVVLIVTLSFLVILAMLATVFATLTSVERNISRNYVDTIRARFLAESGIHSAISAVRTYLDGGGNFTGTAKADKMWLYRGEDANLNNVLDTSGGAEWDVSWLPEFPGTPNKVDTASVPLEVVPNPSFAVEASPTSAAYNPRWMTVNGIPRVGVSGVLDDGTYGRNSDIYTLRVMSSNSLIYVNDININLPRILDYLCDELGITRYGNAIWAGRRYGSTNDLKKVIPVAADYDRLIPFLTTEAWVDNTVVNPVPLSAAEIGKYLPALNGNFYRRPLDGAGLPIYRAGHGWAYTSVPLGYANRNGFSLRFCTNAFSQASRRQGGIYGWDEVNPQWIEATSRAPIDLNSAPKEILTSILRGLKGFFAMETATSIPHYGYDFYHRLRYDPDPAAPYKCGTPPANAGTNNCWGTTWDRWHVDELATLYETMTVQRPLPVAVPPARPPSLAGPDARDLADAILACRPFKSWEEFHTFCDTLVDPNQDTTPGQRFKNTLASLPLPSPLIQDNRLIWTDPSTGVSYQSRKRIAAQAMADVLKANFNPNLHLNELNPNAPLLWQVDKTDLIVASTEGTLRPMGTFRIDSLGRVLEPATPGGDAFTSANNTVVAETRMYATVKVYDVYRETTQKDFYAGGKFEPKAAGYMNTNYGLAVESGPEAHNGPAAKENEWEGYIQLATNGGDSPGPIPNDGAVRSTPRGSGSGEVASSRAHGHFMYDFDLHFGASSADCQALTSGPIPIVAPPYRSPGTPFNLRDPGEPATPFTSPYCSRYNPSRYRQARSFRVDKNNNIVDSAGNPLATFRYAPSDHRVDGAYSERHSALVYSPQNYHWRRGTVEYWIKPGYNLMNAGKIRNYFNLSRLRDPSQGGSETFDPSPFVHAFLPHQVYDLQRSSPDPSAALMADQDILPFNYILEILKFGGGVDWGPGEQARALRAIYDPDLRTEVVNNNHLGTMVGFKPRSFAFGYAQVLWNSNVRSQLPAGTGQWPPVSPEVRTEAGGGMAGQEIAINTRCLNHAGHQAYPFFPWNHPDRRLDVFDAGKGDVMEQGHWTHVILAWRMDGNTDLTGWDDAAHFRQIVQLRVNGRLYNSNASDVSHWSPQVEQFPNDPNPMRLTWQTYQPLPGFPALWMTDEYGNRNPIRIGSPSILDPRHHPLADTNREEGSYPADSTIDELSLWSSQPVVSPTGGVTLQNAYPGSMSLSTWAWNHFQVGRYYKGTLPQFTSKIIDLTAGQFQRKLPPPVGSAATPPPPPVYRLYGLYWTAYNDKIYDYSTTSGGGLPRLLGTGGTPPVGLTFRVSLDGASNFTGPSYSTEQYSFVGQDITDPKKFQYQFEFTGTSNLSYTLLETPILDDVWVVYGPQQAEILEWTVQ